MKFRNLGRRKRLALLAYLLLAYGALIYASLITLNLDFTWRDNTLVAQVPRTVDEASLFLEFKTAQEGVLPIKVISTGVEVFEGQLPFSTSSNFLNYLVFKKIPNLNKGSLELQFDRRADISEVRIEYRYSALRYYWDSIKAGDLKAIGLLFVWLLVFAVGILLWKFGLKTNLLLAAAAGHLFFLWAVFEPMSGYDDTYHLPGAAVMSTSLSRDEVRRETVKLIKDANFMSIRRVPLAIAKELSAKADYCPHIFSFPEYTIEDCPFGDDFNLVIYSKVLRVFSLNSVSAIEVGLKILNQIVFSISLLVLAITCSLLFNLTWSNSFKIMLAASLSFFPLVPQTMTTGHDLVFFLISAIELLLLTKIWKSKGHRERAFCLLLSFFLVTPFILNAQENNKTYIILVVPILTLLSFLYSYKSVVSNSKSSRSRELAWFAFALFLVLPLGFYFYTLMSPLIWGTLLHFRGDKVTYAHSALISLPKVFELSLDEVIGSVISGKIYPPSPVKAFYLFLLFGLGGMGIRRFFHQNKFLATIMITLLLGIIAILLGLGSATRSEIWISLRFAYSLVPVFWLLYAAGFLETEDFDSVPALVGIIAVNTIYLPAFVFPLLG